MKALKFKTVLLAIFTAVLVVLCHNAVASDNRFKTHATTTFVQEVESDFVLTCSFTPKDGGEEVQLILGESSYRVVVNVLENYVSLSNSDLKELKKAEHNFEYGKDFKITLVVNDEITRVYFDDVSVAVLVYKTGSITGSVKIEIEEGSFDVGAVALHKTDTIKGDIFCLGYDVLKVINLTDGNYKLADTEYSVDKGVLTVSKDYLKTLEENTTYRFKVVTSFTDLNFKITTDFSSVSAYSAVEKYYRNNDISINLSADVQVTKITVDDKDCDFTQDGKTVTISKENADNLALGSHNVKLYTSAGRPEATFSISEIVETISEPVVVSTHLFFWIDIAILLTLILGYGAFSVYKKYKG